MGRRPASSTLLLLILFFFISYLAFTCAPHGYNELVKMPQFHVDKAVVFASFLFSHGNDAASNPLNQTTRMTIFDFVRDSPGLHFRAISGMLKMPIGVLQYHLSLLVSRGYVSVYHDGRYRRFFESKKFTETEMKTISALRRKVSGMILTVLLKEPRTTHKELARQVDASSQALSWQMKQLEKANLVERSVEELNVRYSLTEAVREIVDRYVTLPLGAAGTI